MEFRKPYRDYQCKVYLDMQGCEVSTNRWNRASLVLYKS